MPTPTDAMVRDSAAKMAFSRGEALLASGAVTSWEAAAGCPTTVRGSIKERSGACFEVRVNLDLQAQEITGHECSCTCSGELCKHGVALALAYLDALRTGRAKPGANASSTVACEPARPDTDELAQRAQEIISQYGHAAEEGQRRLAVIQEPPTSPLVSELVYRYAQPVPPRMDETPMTGQVDLLCSLSPAARSSKPDDGAWSIRLRLVAGTQMYLVRHIDELLDAWEQEKAASYGRSLVFIHNREAFTQSANEVLGLLACVLHGQKAARAAARQSMGPIPEPNLKALVLSDHDVIELLDTLQGKEMRFEPRGVTGRSRSLVVTKGEPTLEVALHRGERGGYDLVLPPAADCVLTAGAMYLLTNGQAARCSDAFRARMGAFCRAALPADGPLHIREDDLPGFCGTVLPILKDRAHLTLPEDLEVLLPPPATFEFRFALVRGHVTCDALVSYAKRSVKLFDEPQPGQPVRDTAREEAARTLVREHFGLLLMGRGTRGNVPTVPWTGGTLLGGRPCFDADDTEALYRFLTQGMAAFAEFGEVYLAESLRSITVRPAPRVRVEASVRGNLLDIAVDSGDLSPHDLLAYLASYERKERYIRLDDGDILRLDDGGLKAVAELAAGLGISTRALIEGTGRIPANRALFVDSMMKRSCVRFDRDEGFRKIVRDFDAIEDADFAEPASLRDVLRPYQRAGFKWLSTLAHLGFGGILADDMGLGKTLQVVAFLLARREEGCPDPSLVVCPASLVYNWTAEMARFAPELAVEPVVGNREERRRAIMCARGYDVLVTSYELLKRDIDLYTAQHFYCQALDEAQYIKNPSTQSARCAKQIDADVRLALTGTPIENRLSELWSIFDYLMPGMLGGTESFRRRFEIPIASGDEGAAARLQCLVSPFVLRRMKADVLKDLPEKTESTVAVPLEGEQDKLYRACASQLAMSLAHQLPHDFAHERLAVLAELTKLRQLCCDPHLLYSNYEGGSAKLEAAIELLRNAVDSGHKALLFSQFTSMLDLIAERLGDERVAYHMLTGATPKEERARLVSSFETDAVPVFLISLKAGGVGLNLTAADIVIHYDPWWNLAAQNQATDRAHRIGQTRPVTVFKLIAQGTIEEKICALQESKRDLAERVLGGDGALIPSLTREDILALLES